MTLQKMFGQNYSVLNERAVKVVSQLTLDQCKDYDVVKGYLLDAFKATSDTYLRRLQNSRRTGTESYRMFLSRLQEYQTFYLQCKRIDSFDALKDDCLLNTFIQTLPDEVVEFVRSKEVKTASEAASAADLCYSVHGYARASIAIAKGKHRMKPFVNDVADQPEMQQTGYRSKERGSDFSDSKAKGFSKSQENKQVVCFLCNNTGHKKNQCPKNKTKEQGQTNKKAQATAFVGKTDSNDSCSKLIIPVYIGDDGKQYVSFRDTGSDVT